MHILAYHTVVRFFVTFLLQILLQSLAVVTLGDKQMAQRVDNLVDVDEFKRFYLQVSLVHFFHYKLV